MSSSIGRVRNIVKRLLHANSRFLKVSSLSAIATLTSQIATLVIQKGLAVTLGPSGVALFSQFQNFVSISNNVACGGIQQGVVKYTAYYNNDKKLQIQYVSTALRIVVIVSLLVAGGILYFASQITQWLFDSLEYLLVVRLFSFSVFFFGINNLVLKVLNGANKINTYISIQLIGSIINVIIVGAGIYWGGIYGALISFSSTQILLFFVSMYIIVKTDLIKFDFLRVRENMTRVKNLLSFSVIAIFTLFFPPFIQILIRNYVIDSEGLVIAGLWDATLKLSAIYIGIASAALPVYLLPKFSSLDNKEQLQNEVKNLCLMLIPVLFCFGLVIYCLSGVIIQTIYSSDFLNISKYIHWVIIGDVMRICSLIYAYIFIAKSKVSTYILVESMSLIFLYIASIYFFEKDGVEGLAKAYMFNYGVYLFALVGAFKGIKNFE